MTLDVEQGMCIMQEVEMRNPYSVKRIDKLPMHAIQIELQQRYALSPMVFCISVVLHGLYAPTLSLILHTIKMNSAGKGLLPKSEQSPTRRQS